MPRFARVSVAVVVLALTIGVAAVPIGPLPRLGPFLDPYGGAWSTTTTTRLKPFLLLRDTPGLDSSVSVHYDARAVPHIFARTEHDAYFALGVVVARDRLAQLEVQNMAASGRLTELAGAAALPLDRETRGLGLPRAAERAVAGVDTASAGWRAVRAYTDGVNAWLDQLRTDEHPFEFHLLDRPPERWAPINSLYLLGRMSYTLATDTHEFERAAAAARVGRAAADALFPMHSPLQEPIVPARVPTPRLLGGRLPPPGAPDDGALLLATAITAMRRDGLPAPDPDRDRGSNNWAVAPRRTAHGAALLAGDPHLDLTLPSIWYEAHLVVPGRLDVAGVTIPGAPGILIGFTRDLAWTFTNTGADVADYYAETVDDDAHPSHYRVDGAWRPVERRVERYRDAHGAVLATDTIRFTHRGPLRKLAGRWLSMRWTALEPSDDIGAVVDAAHTRTARDWLHAMEPFLVPAQNMLVADRAGTIAIRSTGHFPIRPGDGRGDYVRDGSTSASDWLGFRPVADYPTAIDPAQGFLASANQEPEDPTTSSAYLNTDWPPAWRAMRIATHLRATTSVTVDTMRAMQTDPVGARAAWFLPYFLRAAARPDASSRAREAARLLAQWDGGYRPDDQRAVLFEAAMTELTRRTWDELAGPDGRLVAEPGGDILAALLVDSTSAWWDDRSTPGVVEGRDAILDASLAAALDRVTTRYGAPDAGGWRRDRIVTANIFHLLQIPQLSRLGLHASGGPSTLSPLSGAGTDGPSWRMVVELGPTVRAWATYPGGQSGNPFSDRYDDRVPGWLAGTLDSIRTPRTPSDLGADERAILEIDPPR